MRRLTLLLLLCVLGCSAPEPPTPHKYSVGQKVTIKVNGKPAIVKNRFMGNEYGIAYSNDLGELKYDHVDEYELEPYKER